MVPYVSQLKYAEISSLYENCMYLQELLVSVRSACCRCFLYCHSLSYGGILFVHLMDKFANFQLTFYC